MGNQNSSTRPKSAPHSSSPSASGHDSPKDKDKDKDKAPTSSSTPTRRDARGLIHSHYQRTAARPEPSLAQAHGSNVVHRKASSQSDRIGSFPPHSSLSSSETAQGAPAREEPRPDIRDEPSKPVDFPASKPVSGEDNAPSARSSESQSQAGDPLATSSSIQDMSYHLTRPPRLPLPIEEEVHTPGSPIIPPIDANEPIPVLDVGELDDEALPRQQSAVSNTTVDEDEEELAVDQTKATVPTVLEWSEGGGKVYVTGTIFQWNKKHRLHPVPGHPGLLRATIHIRPGTHHVRFIVDGDMKCSTNLPTTVDFGNNLVNYIEVSPDDLPSEAPSTTQPTTIADRKDSNLSSAASGTEEEAPRPKPKTRSVISPDKYTTIIPQYLLDLDKEEGHPAYQDVAQAIEKLPTPPSLPGFLGKPILNAATPMKDDNSVLTMPNHTVLNHLATSSIKQNVLAVSVTTRYKRKYVTTILYKPTQGDD